MPVQVQEEEVSHGITQTRLWRPWLFAGLAYDSGKDSGCCAAGCDVISSQFSHLQCTAAGLQPATAACRPAFQSQQGLSLTKSRLEYGTA